MTGFLPLELAASPCYCRLREYRDDLFSGMRGLCIMLLTRDIPGLREAGPAYLKLVNQGNCWAQSETRGKKAVEWLGNRIPPATFIPNRLIYSSRTKISSAYASFTICCHILNMSQPLISLRMAEGPLDKGNCLACSS